MLGTSDSEPNWLPFGGGDKTSPYYGATDAWVLRLDENGQKLWEQSFGGSGTDDAWAALEMDDGGFVLGCYSTSPADGNKTSTAVGDWHSWFIGVDAFGNKLWERSSTGSGPDIVKGTDRGLVVAGHGSGFGDSDYGVSRVDRHGNLVWEVIVGGSRDDTLMQAAETLDGGLILVGFSLSDVDGNKTVRNHGHYDFWVVKVGPDPVCDSDNDGVGDYWDLCPDTPAAAMVNARGCSIKQLVPCEGPWKNHREYVQKVAQKAKQFYKAKIISRKQWFRAVAAATQSDCGREEERREFRRMMERLLNGARF